MTCRVIALIPARGGSKSIKDKNIVPFCDKPLISYTIKHALRSKLIDRVIVSTDSKRIADVAKHYGAEVPFIRPFELAQDDTVDLPVFEHCLDYLKNNELYIPDIIVHLRPTSPLRTVSMIDDAINLLIENSDASSVRCVCEPAQNPFKMWAIGKDGFIKSLINSNIHEAYNQPRQALPEVYWQNGYVDIMRCKTISRDKSMTGDKILPLIVDSENIIDIDNLITLKLAEYIYQDQKKTLIK
jgi:CMP-N,N'-diacetyllegionaminic acid synthase